MRGRVRDQQHGQRQAHHLAILVCLMAASPAGQYRHYRHGNGHSAEDQLRNAETQ
jgi:hypothetical protein